MGSTCKEVMRDAWSPPDMTLVFQAKEFNLCFIRLLFLMVWESLRWQTASACHVLLRLASSKKCFQTPVYRWCYCTLGPSVLQKSFCTLPLICASIQSWFTHVLGLDGWVCALTCAVTYGSLCRQLCAFPNHVQSTELTTNRMQFDSPTSLYEEFERSPVVAWVLSRLSSSALHPNTCS